MAFELAKQGLKILLISRTESKLIQVKEEIEAKVKDVQVRYVSLDFAGGLDKHKISTLAQAIKDLDIGILINNVGMSYPFTKYYHELNMNECSDLVALNLESTMILTKLVLGDSSCGMIARKRGAIINTSSAAGTQISPLLAGYSGAKGGIVMFSKSLAAELKPKFGIDVQVQTPLFVTTKLAKIKRSSITVPTPSTYAKAASRAIGYDVAISPYWSHALQLWLMDALPTTLAIAIVSNMHHAIRKKGLKKEAAKGNASEDNKKAQ
eukprot:CAMPEP_0197289038 /NCGR_PEP_ID=MMETSP0890-20130614/6241_1 /TAXON_ID=44058 ORGANISM="Aureoumbra lagunensis, Strain CCMP1510" /NCGR_SAMPLE_ID=MMETSP0890 /ASSEMBLY_ACC=CAM_ASM_000533 /LENGTH=265 /DNA_ID=CAMNT_0042760183 /DNA_START=121 /DNA_END=918 /DNA_ORIENTATION=+